MNIYVLNNKSHYEIMSLAKVFFSNKKIIIKHDELPKDNKSDYILALVNEKNHNANLFLKVNLRGKLFTKNEELIIKNKSDMDIQRLYKRVFTKLLYEILSKEKNKKLEWGSLTGVRPVKLITTRQSQNISNEEIEKEFRNTFHVSEKRINLAMEIAKNQRDVIKNIEDNDFSLYINIPFCPSKCNYCSFISNAVKQSEKIIPEYINKLAEEIKYTAKIIKAMNLKLKTIYIGGGTPTVLSKKELTMLLDVINNNFSFKYLTEYTVEAGRPDTIDEEKLKILSGFNVNRISINPQTLNDKTLKIIGRNHNVDVFYKSYELAKEYFENINTDLIAGLIGENLEDFKYTLDNLLKIHPSNITIHSLARKKSAKLHGDVKAFENREAIKMLDYAYKNLFISSYKPYYLYRQKNSVENLENTGFFKEDKKYIGLYNIYMMEEVSTVISCGAGGVTKIINNKLKDNKINRIFNYKYPFEYIKNFEEIINRKDKILKYY